MTSLDETDPIRASQDSIRQHARILPLSSLLSAAASNELLGTPMDHILRITTAVP
jgi:hypothetical protein